MPHRIKNWLEDIRTCICNIENFILSKDSEISIAHVRTIVNLRNQITHGYDEVSNERIWAIIVNQLPRLKKEVDQ